MKTKTSLIIAIMVVLALAGSAKATLVNSNSIIQDDIEYYIQTDKAIYDLGENVEMLFRVTNLRSEDVTIPCSRSPEFNFWVKEDGETIWMKVHGFFQYSPGIALSTGESVELSHIWDMIDDTNSLVEPGVYNVIGVMYNEPWNYDNYGEYIPTEVAVSITIIPEPSSLALFTLGVLALVRKLIF